MSRTAAFSFDCGDGSSTYNATTTVAQSKAGTAPLVSIDQGAFWKACANAGVADSAGNTYYLGLPTDAEWLKASSYSRIQS